MTTLDLSLVPRITLADLRRAHAPVVLAVLLLVIVAVTSGLTVAAGQRARDEAARAEHQRVVAQRVDALVADWTIEGSFLDGTRSAASDARLAAVVAERAQVAAFRTQALKDAATVLAGSAGKADDASRNALAAAIAALNAPESVYSRVTGATVAVTTSTLQVTAAVAAWDAEQARVAAAAAAQQAAGVRSVSYRRGTTSVVAAGSSVRDVGEATLRSLPGNAGVSIHWDDPDLGGHLGGVWSGSTSYMMVSSTRLAGNPSRTRDVVRHEIAHIYQGRLAATYGLSWTQLGTRMSAAFGTNAQEKAADCVARHFGASWTHYTSDCSGADKQAWVAGMIGGYLP